MDTRETEVRDDQNIDSIFSAAVELESASERVAYLDRACGRDPELRGRVDKLLAAQARAGSFMEDSDDPDATIDRPVAGQPGSEQPGTEIGPYKLLQIIG